MNKVIATLLKFKVLTKKNANFFLSVLKICRCFPFTIWLINLKC